MDKGCRLVVLAFFYCAALTARGDPWVILNLPLRPIAYCELGADEFVWSRSCTSRSKISLSLSMKIVGPNHKDQDHREGNPEKHDRLLAGRSSHTHDFLDLLGITCRFIPPPLSLAVSWRVPAGELQEDLFQVGLANVQAGSDGPASVIAFSTSGHVRVLHPDL